MVKRYSAGCRGVKHDTGLQVGPPHPVVFSNAALKDFSTTGLHTVAKPLPLFGIVLVLFRNVYCVEIRLQMLLLGLVFMQQIARILILGGSSKNLDDVPIFLDFSYTCLVT